MSLISRCESCRHFESINGLCRKNPPVVVVFDAPDVGFNATPLTVWPEVDRMDWCGGWGQV